MLARPLLKSAQARAPYLVARALGSKAPSALVLEQGPNMKDGLLQVRSNAKSSQNNALRASVRAISRSRTNRPSAMQEHRRRRSTRVLRVLAYFEQWQRHVPFAASLLLRAPCVVVSV